MTNFHQRIAARLAMAVLLMALTAAPSLAGGDVAQAPPHGLSCIDQMDTEPFTDEGDVIPVSAPACDADAVPVAI